jgi:hypothetical protein
MTLANEFFPKLSGGNSGGERLVKEGTKIVSDASEAAMIPGAKIWERLNRRNPQTGAPEGAVAIMKERMFRMFTLRARKMFSRPYGRCMQFA